MPIQRMLDAINAVAARRPRTVLQHILEHGSVSTDELTTLYGYDHAPRAARDVRELGIPLKTEMRTDPATGRRMAHYMLGDEDDLRSGRAGRRLLPKGLRTQLLAIQGEQCAICDTPFEARALQTDHRVPYEVGSDPVEPLLPQDFMLICGSCNRSKSYSCEHCRNWLELLDPTLCQSCYWGSPDQYTHTALEERRQVTLNWVGDDQIHQYEALHEEAAARDQEVPELAREIIEDWLESEGTYPPILVTGRAIQSWYQPAHSVSPVRSDPHSVPCAAHRDSRGDIRHIAWPRIDRHRRASRESLGC